MRFILGDQLEPLTIIEVLDPEKASFRPSNGLKILGTEKLLKKVSFHKTVLSWLE
jgi:hypothetical protein